MFVAASAGAKALADDEAYVVTPTGFTTPGTAKTASGSATGRLRIKVRDRATGRPTFCRLNVVGPDGHFYQPPANPLSPYTLTGQWPETGKGNRQGKAPIRYLGRFFYSSGEIDVAVPAGRRTDRGLEGDSSSRRRRRKCTSRRPKPRK